MKGIVYQIYLESNPNIHYVGSTIQTLEKRWSGHKNAFKNKTKRRPIICQYFDEFGIDNFQIRVIKEYDIVDNQHLLAYEQLWINKLKPINILKTLIRSKNIVKISDKIYRENNRETIREKKQIYWQNNREKFSEKKSSLYICPCSPDKQLSHGHKSRHERTIKHQKYLQTLEENKE